MSNLKTVEEVKGVCKDRSKWKEVISAYPKGKRVSCCVCMYERDSFTIKRSITYHNYALISDNIGSDEL
jgi:hypothetical protein